MIFADSKLSRSRFRAAAGLALAAVLIAGMVQWSEDEAHAAACSSGSTAAYDGGDGSSGDPYKIATAEQLVYLSEQSQSNEITDSFVQTADIDLAGCEFTPIGKWSLIRGIENIDGKNVRYTRIGNDFDFEGTYDGGGFEISGLSITSNGDAVGLFGYVGGATVENLKVSGAITSSADYVGGVVGLVTNLGDSGDDRGSAATVTISRVISEVDITWTGIGYGGGIVGSGNAGTISYSAYRGAFSTSGAAAGGLAGFLVSGSSITDSYSQVSFAGSSTNQAGILGWNSTSMSRVYSLPEGATKGVANSISGSVTAVFWDAEVGPTAGFGNAPSGSTGATTSSLTSLATFSNASWAIVEGWEQFDQPGKVWGICSQANDGYPFLLSEYDSDPCVAPSGGNSGRSDEDDDDDDEETVTQTPAVAPAPPVVRPRPATSAPTPPAAVIGPVLPTGSVPEPPAAPRVLVGGQRTEIEQSIPDGASLSLRAGSVSLGLSVAEGSGSITTAEDGSAQVAVKQGTTAGFQGAGMQPGATVQVFIPLGAGDARELAQLTVNEDGTFSGEAPFSTDPLADPLPIGTRLLQLVTVDEDGNQVVLDIRVDIEQADPAPAINRDEGVVPAVEPGSAVVMSAGKQTEATITGVEDQKLAVVEGDGWNMSINLEAEDAGVQETETGVILQLVRDEQTQVSGTGFLPGTRADVWLFSEPTLLGTVTIDENGEFSGEVGIDPDLIPTGEHTLQLQGVGQDGYVKAASLGVMVDDASADATEETAESSLMVVWWIVAAVIVLALLLIVFLVARRRRYTV